MRHRSSIPDENDVDTVRKAARPVPRVEASDYCGRDVGRSHHEASSLRCGQTIASSLAADVAATSGPITCSPVERALLAVVAVVAAASGARFRSAARPLLRTSRQPGRSGGGRGPSRRLSLGAARRPTRMETCVARRGRRGTAPPRLLLRHLSAARGPRPGRPVAARAAAARPVARPGRRRGDARCGRRPPSRRTSDDVSPRRAFQQPAAEDRSYDAPES